MVIHITCFSTSLITAQLMMLKKDANMGKLEKFHPTRDVNINIDVKFIRIKERVGKMIYR